MTTEGSPVKPDTNWFPVQITEFLVISIINAITITAFARIRHLRKRSTYLIINLTVADLLIGTVAGPLYVYHNSVEKHELTYPGFFSWTFKLTFLIASPLNLSIISLERLHATLFPFRHCLIRNWFYFQIILGSWLIALLLGSLMAGLYLNEPYSAFAYARTTFDVVNLLVLTVSYLIVVLNFQTRLHLQNVATLQAERKLSVTLLIVTGVSVLTVLPWAIYKSLPQHINAKRDMASDVDIHQMLAVIYFANSIVNPFVYAIRMMQFRNALRSLVSRQRQGRQKRTQRKRTHHSQPDTKL